MSGRRLQYRCTGGSLSGCRREGVFYYKDTTLLPGKKLQRGREDVGGGSSLEKREMVSGVNDSQSSRWRNEMEQ